jgi:hypothetical protein
VVTGTHKHGHAVTYNQKQIFFNRPIVNVVPCFTIDMTSTITFSDHCKKQQYQLVIQMLL